MTMPVGPFALNEVHCVECVEAMRELPDGCVDAVVTDPPYGIEFRSNRTDHQREVRNDTHDEWRELIEAWLPEVRRVLAEHGVMVACCGGGGGPTPAAALFTLAVIEAGLQLIQSVVWKKQPGLGWKYRPSYELIVVASKRPAGWTWARRKTEGVANVVEQHQVIPRRGMHPTTKPVALMRRFIELHTRPGMLVLDPFAGSGTTLVAAKLLGRRSLGFEIEQEYVEIARQRLGQGVLALAGDGDDG